MVYDLEQENKEILARYRDLISNTYRTLDEEQNKVIRKAFDIALDAHKDQRRKTGEPYIYHPIEVAKIVANEIGLGATSIACALLHDVIEDSEYTYEDIKKNLRKKNSGYRKRTHENFGDEPPEYFDSVRKLPKTTPHAV